MMLSFRILRTPVKLSYPALVLFTLSVIISGNDLIILSCVFSSLFHEMGHLIFIKRYCGKIRGISINLGDIAIESDTSTLSKNNELIIDVAGPVANIILSGIQAVLYLLFKAEIFLNISLFSLFIGIFNLLPLKSLDGGNILCNILTRRLSLKVSDRIINISSVIFIIPFLICGFLFLFVSKYNYSLLLIAIYLITLIINKEMR